MIANSQSLNSPEGGGDYLDQYLTRVPVKITAVTPGVGQFTGFNCYSWTEQQFICNTSPVSYQSADAARSGIATLGMALEKNNQLLTPPFFADLRIIGAYNGEPIYEFNSVGAESPFIGCYLFNDPTLTQGVGAVSWAKVFGGYDTSAFFDPLNPAILSTPVGAAVGTKYAAHAHLQLNFNTPAAGGIINATIDFNNGFGQISRLYFPAGEQFIVMSLDLDAILQAPASFTVSWLVTPVGVGTPCVLQINPTGPIGESWVSITQMK